MTSLAQHNQLLDAMARIEALLASHAFAFADEAAFQEGIAKVLTAAGISFTREHVAGPLERFDFLCEHGVVIEAKIKGSFAAALRQCDRYVKHPEVLGVLVCTTRHWGRVELTESTLRGKPVRVVYVQGDAF